MVDEAIKRRLEIIEGIKEDAYYEGQDSCEEEHLEDASIDDMVRSLRRQRYHSGWSLVDEFCGLDLVRVYEDLLAERYGDVLCQIDKAINPAHLSESDLMRARAAKLNATSAAA